MAGTARLLLKQMLVRCRVGTTCVLLVHKHKAEHALVVQVLNSGLERWNHAVCSALVWGKGEQIKL